MAKGSPRGGTVQSPGDGVSLVRFCPANLGDKVFKDQGKAINFAVSG
jgi:hypothetical protein